MKGLKKFSDCQELLAPTAKDILAVGNTAYHGLGLWELVPQATIVCLDDDGLQRQIQSEGGTVFSLEERLGRLNKVFRSTSKLLAQPETIEFIKERSTRSNLYISKPTKRLEIMAKKYGWNLLGASSNLNKLFEDKVSFTKMMAAGGENLPREVCRISKFSLEAAGKKFGWPLVVQFSRGLAGAGTFFIEKDEVGEFVAKHQGREGIVALKLADKGKTITLNACVVPQGVVVGAPFLQITGVESLNSNPGGTCGNDYGVDLEIDSSQRRQVFEKTILIGEIMRKKGYLGLFGIDFVVGDKVWLVEVNARPPASVPTYTQGEHARDEVSLLGLHLLAGLGIPFEVDLDFVNEQKFSADLKGSKLIFRNLSAKPVVTNQEFAAGVYKISNTGELDFLRSASSPAALQGPQEALFWSVKSGKRVNPNIELATLILPKAVTAARGNLTSEVQRIISALSKKISTYVA